MKDAKINIRVSEDIKKQIEVKAKNLGMSVSEYVRFLILKDVENSKKWVLSPMGNIIFKEDEKWKIVKN